MQETPKVGNPAPAFELPDATGKTRTLNELLGTGKIVLVFLRGMW